MVSLEIADRPPLRTRSLKMDRNMSETGIEEEVCECVWRQTEFYMKRIDFDLSDLQKISFEISMI